MVCIMCVVCGTCVAFVWTVSVFFEGAFYESAEPLYVLVCTRRALVWCNFLVPYSLSTPQTGLIIAVAGRVPTQLIMDLMVEHYRGCPKASWEAKL